MVHLCDTEQQLQSTRRITLRRTPCARASALSEMPARASRSAQLREGDARLVPALHVLDYRDALRHLVRTQDDGAAGAQGGRVLELLAHALVPERVVHR